MKSNQKVKFALSALEKEMETLTYTQTLEVLGGSGSGGGYWSWTGTEYVYTVNGGTMDEVVINAGSTGSGHSIQTVVGAFLTTFGISASHAELSATILKLESRVGFKLVSKRFGFAGVAANIYELWEDPNMEDFLQIGLGLAAIGTTGYLGIAMGIGLGAWELIELYNEANGGSGGSGGSTLSIIDEELYA